MFQSNTNKYKTMRAENVDDQLFEFLLWSSSQLGGGGGCHWGRGPAAETLGSASPELLQKFVLMPEFGDSLCSASQKLEENPSLVVMSCFIVWASIIIFSSEFWYRGISSWQSPRPFQLGESIIG